MDEIIKEIGDTYFMLVHQNSKNSQLGSWYVIGVDELKLKYPVHPAVFHSNTPEECLKKLLEELRTIRK